MLLVFCWFSILYFQFPPSFASHVSNLIFDRLLSLKRSSVYIHRYGTDAWCWSCEEEEVDVGATPLSSKQHWFCRTICRPQCADTLHIDLCRTGVIPLWKPDSWYYPFILNYCRVLECRRYRCDGLVQYHAGYYQQYCGNMCCALFFSGANRVSCAQGY